MSIHPQYAFAILEGRKRVEFRKRRLAPDVSTVLIYATSPVRRIVGSFAVEEIVAAEPSSLWREVGEVGCISKGDFDRYYDGVAQAVGIRVGAVERFVRPVALDELSHPPAVPQSFAYVDAALMREARARATPPVVAVQQRLRDLLHAVWEARALAAPRRRAS